MSLELMMPGSSGTDEGLPSSWPRSLASVAGRFRTPFFCEEALFAAIECSPKAQIVFASNMQHGACLVQVASTGLIPSS